MREITTKKKPVFVQANSNSGQGHVLHYITSFCVVFRLSTLYFWLAGKTETKQVVNRMSKWVEGGGSWKGHESGQAVFIFLAASPLVLARFAREFFLATPLLACARLDKTAMLRRLVMNRRWYSRQPLINHDEVTLALTTDPRNRSDERFPLYVLEWVLLQCVIFTGSSRSYNFEWIWSTPSSMKIILTNLDASIHTSLTVSPLFTMFSSNQGVGLTFKQGQINKRNFIQQTTLNLVFYKSIKRVITSHA